ncbi:MAG: sulfotransferase [Polyangiaceae bacterium]
MQRFVVLAHPRSGSTLLIAGLEQHPELTVHNELLTTTEDEASRRRLYSVAGRFLHDGGDEADFLRHVYAASAQSRATGFKLMHHHASRAGSTVWDFFESDPELGVIHVYRDDALETLISERVAQKTGIWNVVGDGPLPDEPPPFTIEPAEARARFDELEAWRRQARRRFAPHPFLELEYRSDLVSDFGGSMARVFEFLGVPPVPVTEKLARLRRLRPAEQVANFAELAAAFAGSPYERFFASAESSASRR